jgi:hypothetical protein
MADAKQIYRETQICRNCGCEDTPAASLHCPRTLGKHKWVQAVEVSAAQPQQGKAEPTWTAWARPNRPDRKDIIGVRDLPDGRQEYLMHNEGLCRPYYLAVSAPAAQLAAAQAEEIPEPQWAELRLDGPPTCHDIAVLQDGIAFWQKKHDALEAALRTSREQLAAMREERDRLQAALTVYQMAFHDACIDAHPEDDGFQEYKLQSLRNAEAEMKMLDVVVPLFMKELGLEPPVSDRQPEGGI